MKAPAPIVELCDVLDKLNEYVSDFNTLMRHTSCGTGSQYYNSMLLDLILDLTNIPIERQVRGIEETDDPEEAVSTWKAIAERVGTLFDKAADEVEADMALIANVIPIDDIRQSKFHQRTNTLH